MKRIKIIFIVILILIGIYITLNRLTQKNLNKGNTINRIGVIFFDFNSLSVSGQKSLRIDLNGSTIYKNNKKTGVINNDYGWVCFELFTNELKVQESCIYRKNNWTTNQFIFERSNFKQIPYKLTVIGPDSIGDVYHKVYDRHFETSIIRYLNKQEQQYNVDTITSKPKLDK